MVRQHDESRSLAIEDLLEEVNLIPKNIRCQGGHISMIDPLYKQRFCMYKFSYSVVVVWWYAILLEN
jgi:hypothetical protein